MAESKYEKFAVRKQWKLYTVLLPEKIDFKIRVSRPDTDQFYCIFQIAVSR